MQTRLTKLQGWLFTPVTIAPLVYLRIIFGAIMVWEVWRYVEYGWIAPYFIAPQFHFKYYGFEWVQAMDGDGMYWHFLLMAVLGICVCLGLFYRLIMPLFFLSFAYVFLLDQSLYLNHFYLVVLLSFLLIFVPAHRNFSLDSLLFARLRTRQVPAWTVWLFKLQLGIVYFYAGVAKLNPDWLRGEPMRAWLSSRTDFPFMGQFFTEEWLVYLFSYGGMLIDLLAFPLLLWKRTRYPMMLFLLVFHLTNYQLFNIGIFPWMMIGTLPLFLPLAHWQKLDRWLFKPVEEAVKTGVRYAWVSAALAAYFVFQLLFPLRHWLYPGDVAWTEEGHRFSWRMKLRDKEGDIIFYVDAPNQNLFREVDPREYLFNWQIEEMAGRPDMILQFARYLRDVYEENGYSNVNVRAMALVSLNGRSPSMLIDTAVNLAEEPRPLLSSARWILPMGTGGVSVSVQDED